MVTISTATLALLAFCVTAIGVIVGAAVAYGALNNTVKRLEGTVTKLETAVSKLTTDVAVLTERLRGNTGQHSAVRLAAVQPITEDE